LYKRARRGEDVEVAARDVDVFRFDLLKHEGNRLSLHVECGSGTYVRSLARDLGELLGCGAHLTALRRLWVDPFRQPRMFTLDELAAAETPDSLLLPLEDGLAALPALSIDAADELRLRQGKTLLRQDQPQAPLACAIDPSGKLVALVEIGATGEVRVKRGFN
jgi:tRNA pseudouridine55 synthase